MEELALGMAKKLQEAGVGERPCVFVTHSMGGILVKMALVASSQAVAPPSMSTEPDLRQLARNTKGIVFYSTPHFGANWAGLGSMTARPLR